MSLYGELSFVDILEPIKDKFKIDVDEEGNPKVHLNPILGVNTPWISSMPKIDRQCQLWSIYFNNYRIIPKTCRKCFKVSMQIDTLEKLFKVLDYQRDNKDCGKCGIEKRAFTGRLSKYSAFWYAPIDGGLDEAKKLFKRVSRDWPSMKCILKRGCTEFELAYNPTDKWDDFATKYGWDGKEHLLDQLFVVNPLTIKVEMNTPPMLEAHIVRKWIEWAFEHNDKTYLEYVDAPFKQELLNYENREDVYVDSGSGEATGVWTCQLGGQTDENCGEQTGRKASLIQGLPES